MWGMTNQISFGVGRKDGLSFVRVLSRLSHRTPPPKSPPSRRCTSEAWACTHLGRVPAFNPAHATSPSALCPLPSWSLPSSWLFLFWTKLGQLCRGSQGTTAGATIIHLLGTTTPACTLRMTHSPLLFPHSLATLQALPSAFYPLDKNKGSPLWAKEAQTPRT